MTAKIVYFPGFALLLILSAVIGCSSQNTAMPTGSSANAEIVTCPTASVMDVAISGFAFQPNSVSVAVDDIVRWTNDDSATHTVTSGTPGAADGKFNAENLTQNATVCIRFLQPGSYPYFCSIHTYMTGTVTVQ